MASNVRTVKRSAVTTETAPVVKPAAPAVPAVKLPPAEIFATVRSGENSRDGGSMIATEKTFATGSRGYFGTFKTILDGRRYQVQLMAVEIGSKPKR